MRVTVKGQVTIPQKIRERLMIQPGDEVDFVLDEDGDVNLVKAEAEPNSRTRFAQLRGIATVPMSTDEIMALTRRDE
jgi:AbrB family looped-hinge helix DNA binding protein